MTIGSTCTRRTILAGIGAGMALPVAAHVPSRLQAPLPGIERLDPRLDAIVAPDAAIEVIATGYRWAEGPVWNARDDSLLFSDVPANVVYRWTPGGVAQPFLRPSGLAGPIPVGVREAGANGLAIDSDGRLVLADSGTRVIARVDLATKAKTVLADRFEGKRFNSPNDVALARDGAIYFTDPPYGLEDGDDSPLRELDFNGVYRLDPTGSLIAIDRILTRPNGVALSPDERTLYVAISDRDRPEILAYALGADGMPHGVRRFADMRNGLAAGLPGLPDGLKTDRNGTVFATGPGGVHVFTPAGELLGRISTGVAIANCAIGQGGRMLFLASSDRIARVPLV